MASAIAETPVTPVTPAPPVTTVRDRVVDVVGRASHMAHDARMLATRASGAVEDGVQAAKRAIAHGAHQVDGLREETANHVRKAPLQSIALAAGAGMLVGIAVGWWGRRTTTVKE